MQTSLNNFKAKALDIHKNMAQNHIEVNEKGIKVVVAENGEITEFSVEGITSPDAIEVLNKAIRLSQDKALSDISNSRR